METDMATRFSSPNQAKASHARGPKKATGQRSRQKQNRLWKWNKIRLGVGAAVAVAGAAAAARRYFGTGSEEDQFQLRLETDESMRLISSKKVEGTPVVDHDAVRIGAIDSFMVDKYTGRVAYAVMSFGGKFGFGGSLFPLPWSLLEYDEEKGGYSLDITKDQLDDAPRFEPNDEPQFDPEYRRQLIVFYRDGSSI
jgi:hypothetical protein